MTSTEEVGRVVRRYVGCADAVVAAYSRIDVPVASDLRSSTVRTYNESMYAVDKLWHATVCASGAAEQAAGARAWLDAYLEHSLFRRLEAMLQQLHNNAALVVSAVAPLTPRHNAFQVVITIGQAAFTLLSHASHAAYHVATTTNSPTSNDLSLRAEQALTHRDFMQAVAGASRGVTVTCALLRSETGVRQLSGPALNLSAATTQQASMASAAAAAVCRYTHTITQLLLIRLHKASIGSGAGPAASSIPPGLKPVYEALAETQLLAVSAGAVLEDPGIEALPEAVRHRVCYGVNSAAVSVCAAVVHMNLLWVKTAQCGLHEGRQLAAGALRALRHRQVQRLQVALLDRLAVHAGMDAGLVVEGQGAQQGGPGGQQAGGWVGSSGTWWLAREEQRQGRLLGWDLPGGDGSGEARAEARGNTAAGWLEDLHRHVLCGTLFDWGSVPAQLAGQAGVEARPPPLLVARLAARAAESLCQLCRGQGLGGVYATAPEWKLTKTQLLMLAMVPDAADADELPAATARTCLPYWLEAGGWAAALQADGVAAAMGRLPASQRPQGPRHDVVEQQYCQEGTQAVTLMQLLARVSRLVHGRAHQEVGDAYGYRTLPDAAQADVRRRLSRCGLAATLDHTLRLVHSAQQDGLTYSNSSTCSSSLRQVSQLGFASALALSISAVECVIESGIIPLLQPPSSATPAVSGAAISSSAERAGDNSDRGGAGGGRCGGHQLGVLYTLSKGAAVLTRELDGISDAAGGSSTRGQPEMRLRLLNWAALELEALVNTTECVQKEMLRRMAETHGLEEGQDSGEEAAWGWEAGCVDEVHEALALAARAACNLAAPLGWALAADLAAAAEGGAGSAVQLSREQMTGVMSLARLLRSMADWWRPPLLLPPAQLLAGQPHRLLAAACALVAVLPPTDTYEAKSQLGVWLPTAVVAMAAHRTLSSQVRSWMAPRPAAAAAAAAPVPAGRCAAAVASGEANIDEHGGCLVLPLQSAVWHTTSPAAPCAAQLLALLKIAAGEVAATPGVPCRAGGHDATEEADGGFQQCAAGMAAEVVGGDGRSASTGVLEQLPLPHGSLLMELLDREQLGAGGKPPSLAPPCALPPLLALPPSPQGALPRLRVCGNPRCGNFTERSEGALPLKQCGGCRAVRYCGKACQEAHWREGHKAECKALARARATELR